MPHELCSPPCCIKRSLRQAAGLSARLPHDVCSCCITAWKSVQGCAGSDVDESVEDCLSPVPSDELLDLIDEQSASDSEVRSTHCCCCALLSSMRTKLFSLVAAFWRGSLTVLTLHAVLQSDDNNGSQAPSREATPAPQPSASAAGAVLAHSGSVAQHLHEIGLQCSSLGTASPAHQASAVPAEAGQSLVDQQTERTHIQSDHAHARSELHAARAGPSERQPPAFMDSAPHAGQAQASLGPSQLQPPLAKVTEQLPSMDAADIAVPPPDPFSMSPGLAGADLFLRSMPALPQPSASAGAAHALQEGSRMMPSPGGTTLLPAPPSAPASPGLSLDWTGDLPLGDDDLYRLCDPIVCTYDRQECA